MAFAAVQVTPTQVACEFGIRSDSLKLLLLVMMNRRKESFEQAKPCSVAILEVFLKDGNKKQLCKYAAETGRRFVRPPASAPCESMVARLDPGWRAPAACFWSCGKDSSGCAGC